MKRINIKKILLFTCINALVFFSVAGIFSGNPRLVKFNNLEFLKKKGDSIAVLMTITIENPNFFSISGENVEVISSNTSGFIGKGNMEPFTIKAHSSDSLKVLMMLKADRMMAAYTTDGDNFESTITINGNFSPLFFTHSVTIESKVPKKEINGLILSSFMADNNISFDSLNYRPLSPVESVMNFNVKLKNNFDFDFKIEKVEIELHPSEKSQILLGNWTLNKAVEMTPKSEMSFPGTLHVHHLAVMMAGIEKAGKDLNKAYLRGYASILIDSEVIRAPFSFAVSTDMSKLKIQTH